MHNRDVTFRAICCLCTINVCASAVKWLRRAICRDTRRIVGKAARGIDAVYIYNGTQCTPAPTSTRGVIVPLASVRQKRVGRFRGGRRLGRRARLGTLRETVILIRHSLLRSLVAISQIY